MDLGKIFAGLDFTPFILSLKLACISTVVLLLLCLPLAYFLANTKFKGKFILESILTLPLVLPPSVMGFYLLVIFSKYSYLGEFLAKFGIQLTFTFKGLVLASCIYSLPFMLQPIQNAIATFPKTLIEASYCLGKSPYTTFTRVIMPNIKGAIMTASIIAFAHTMGEFGIVLMIGGSIDGETKLASITIYESLEALDFRSAHIYSAMLLVISFSVLLAVYFLNKKTTKLTERS